MPESGLPAVLGYTLEMYVHFELESLQLQILFSPFYLDSFICYCNCE